MPTKGSGRPHEAIRLTPSTSYSPTVAGPAAAGGSSAGPWRDALGAAGPAGDVDELDERGDLAGAQFGFGDPEGNAGGDAGGDEDPATAEPAARVYRGEQTEVSMPDVTALRRMAAADDPPRVAVGVTVPDGTRVGGEVTVTLRPDRSYDVNVDGLVCGAASPHDCEHISQAGSAVGALLDGRRIGSALGDWEQSHARAAAGLAAAAGAAPARGGGTDTVDWVSDPSQFQAAYQAARARREAGEEAVPYMTENVTDGLGAREGGRPFGVELEFDIPAGVNQGVALAAIGRDLHEAGIIASPDQRRYHSSRDYTQWRFETDATSPGR